MLFLKNSGLHFVNHASLKINESDSDADDVVDKYTYLLMALPCMYLQREMDGDVQSWRAALLENCPMSRVMLLLATS